jgi:hypothetical protein
MLGRKGLCNAETPAIAKAVKGDIIRVSHVYSEERRGDVIVLTTGTRRLQDEEAGENENGLGLESLVRNRRYI